MNSQTSAAIGRAFLHSLFLLGSVGLAATPASAIDISACSGSTISSANAKLIQTLHHSGTTPCLKLGSGKDLDFDQFSIVCLTGTCGPAVECVTTGGDNVDSVVQSTDHTDGAAANISGSFSVGVKNCGTVKNLRIIDATTGVLFDDSSTDAKAVTGNVIEPAAGGTGIDVKIADSLDSVSENLIIGGEVGILLTKGRSTSPGSQVKSNIIRKSGAAGIRSTITTNNFFVFEKNAVIESDEDSLPLDVAGTNGTYNSNICENEGPIDNNRCACEIDRMDPAALALGGCPL